MSQEDLERDFIEIVQRVLEASDGSVSMDSGLLSGESPIDSVRLVELCVALEDYALERGFDFDWTSETAMSRQRGMFRDVRSLFEEFNGQRQVHRK